MNAPVSPYLSIPGRPLDKAKSDLAQNALSRALFSGEFRGEPGNDREAEHKAARIFYPALAAFRSSVQDAMALSDIQRQAFQELLDALSDYTPNQVSWIEKIGS